MPTVVRPSQASRPRPPLQVVSLLFGTALLGTGTTGANTSTRVASTSAAALKPIPSCTENDGGRNGSQTPDSRGCGAPAHTSRQLHGHIRHHKAWHDESADRRHVLPNRFEHQDNDGRNNRASARCSMPIAALVMVRLVHGMY
jgi:hypothetical protein